MQNQINPKNGIKISTSFHHRNKLARLKASCTFTAGSTSASAADLQWLRRDCCRITGSSVHPTSSTRAFAALSPARWRVCRASTSERRPASGAGRARRGAARIKAVALNLSRPGRATRRRDQKRALRTDKSSDRGFAAFDVFVSDALSVQEEIRSCTFWHDVNMPVCWRKVYCSCATFPSCTARALRKVNFAVGAEQPELFLTPCQQH